MSDQQSDDAAVSSSSMVRNGFGALGGLLAVLVDGLFRAAFPVGVMLWWVAEFLGYQPDLGIVVWLLVIEVARLSFGPSRDWTSQ